MLSTRLLAAVAVAASAVSAAGVGCPVFDADFNLYVLGGASDYVIGAQDSWSSASAKTLSASGSRPPFNGAGAPRCYLSQFTNSIYILGADSSKPTDVYILDVAAKSWSLQTVSANGIDPTDMAEILDHDTNTFYALSKGSFWFANFDDRKAASGTLSWTDQGTKPNFNTAGYKPTMGIATNHIHLFGTPGSQPGQANIYVIHYAFPQPDDQLYAAVGGKANFPVVHGQAPSLFRDGPEQTVIVFIPDDSSATYLVNTKTNQTFVAAAPTDKTAGSLFATSDSAVVQLTAAGQLFFLPVAQTDFAAAGANSKAAWTSLTTVPSAGAPSGSGSPSSGGNASSGASSTRKPSSTSGASGSKSTDSASGSGSDDTDETGAASRLVAGAYTLVAALALFMLA